MNFELLNWEKSNTIDFSRELHYIFDNVNNWLKFVEGRISGLIIFNTAVSACIAANCDKLKGHPWLMIVLLFGATCIAFSIIICLFSQYEKRRQNYMKWTKQLIPKDSDHMFNIYFFNYLGLLHHNELVDDKGEPKFATGDSIINELISRLGISYIPNKADKDLAVEIGTNALNTFSKVKIFKDASKLTTIGLGFIIGTAIILGLMNLIRNGESDNKETINVINVLGIDDSIKDSDSTSVYLIGPFETGKEYIKDESSITKLQNFLSFQGKIFSEILIIGGTDVRELKNTVKAKFGDNLSLSQARANWIKSRIQSMSNPKVQCEIITYPGGARNFVNDYTKEDHEKNRFATIIVKYRTDDAGLDK